MGMLMPSMSNIARFPEVGQGFTPYHNSEPVSPNEEPPSRPSADPYAAGVWVNNKGDTTDSVEVRGMISYKDNSESLLT